MSGLIISLRVIFTQAYLFLRDFAIVLTLEEEILDTVKEPPVPPGLRQLSPGLRAFIELFGLDEHLVAAAAEASGSPLTVSEADLRRAIGQLSREQSETWLLRLAQGEPQLTVAFNRELAKLSDRPQPAHSPHCWRFAHCRRAG